MLGHAWIMTCLRSFFFSKGDFWSKPVIYEISQNSENLENTEVWGLQRSIIHYNLSPPETLQNYNKSQNQNIWKGPIRITKVKLLVLCPRVAPSIWEYWPNTSWTLSALELWPLPWAACSSAQPPSFPPSDLHLPWYSFWLFPQNLSLVSRVKKSVPASSLGLMRP